MAAAVFHLGQQTAPESSARLRLARPDRELFALAQEPEPVKAILESQEQRRSGPMAPSLPEALGELLSFPQTLVWDRN